jgi:undecaprenyl-diphosphatase
LSIRRIAYFMLLFLLLFIIVAIVSGMNFPGDASFNTWIKGIQSPFLDSSMPLVSYLGAFPYCIIASLLAGLVFWLFKKKIESLFIIVVPYIGVCISYALKFLIDRPRPVDDLLENSFPSGHTIYTFILMGLIIYFLPQLVKNKTQCNVLQIAAGLLIALMAFSRLYLQQHWLSDVLSSLLIGILVLVPAIILYKYVMKREIKCLSFLKSKP